MASDAAPLPEAVAVQQAYLLLARRLRRTRLPVIGLWPFSSITEFAEVPVLVAKGLASLGLSVGLLVPARWRDHEHKAGGPVMTELGEGVELISPSAPPPNVSAGVEQALAEVQGRYDHVLLDLSGLDIVALKEVALVPDVGTVLFLVPGQINEFALAKVQRQLPPERLLGAVFVDQESGY